MFLKTLEGQIYLTSSSDTDPPMRKKLRSHSDVKTSCLTKPVLPAICVICKKKDSFFYKKRHGTRRDKLIKAETKEAGIKD